MRYYILEQDMGYADIPKLMNWFVHLTASNTKSPDIKNLHNREIITMQTDEDTVCADILFSPIFMISDTVKECLALYEPNMQFKEIILLDQKRRKMQNYFLPSLEEIDCLTSRSEYTFGHVDLKYIELDKNRIGDKSIFKLKGVEKNYIIARLDVVESLLRRGGKGIMVRETDVSDGAGNTQNRKEMNTKGIFSSKEIEQWQKQRMRHIW